LFYLIAQVWREGPKFPFFHLLSSDADYVFTSVTLDAKKEEFHDESRRLCDLHLFVPFLKLVEPNASTKQENILNSQISKLSNKTNVANFCQLRLFREFNTY